MTCIDSSKKTTNLGTRLNDDQKENKNWEKTQEMQLARVWGAESNWSKQTTQSKWWWLTLAGSYSSSLRMMALSFQDFFNAFSTVLLLKCFRLCFLLLSSTDKYFLILVFWWIYDQNGVTIYLSVVFCFLSKCVTFFFCSSKLRGLLLLSLLQMCSLYLAKLCKWHKRCCFPHFLLSLTEHGCTIFISSPNDSHSIEKSKFILLFLAFELQLSQEKYQLRLRAIPE